jgi:uncharacterized protein (TIGR03435 family)
MRIAGITRRIHGKMGRIMSNQTAEAWKNWSPHFFVTVGIAGLAVSIGVGVLLMASPLRAQSLADQPPSSPSGRPTFDVASIKANKSGDRRVMFQPQPGGRFTGHNMTLGVLINIAYQLKAHQMVGGPGWIDSEHFDIEAKAEGNPPMDQMRPMLQSLLADRFKLVVHHETRQFPVYALVVSKAGKTGPRLVLHSDDRKCADISAGPPRPPSPGAPTPCGGMMAGPGHMATQKVTMEVFAGILGNYVDRIVVDQTGLTGVFDLDFEFTPLQTPVGIPRGPDSGAPDPSAPPLIFTAVQEQLGLKLEPQTSLVDVLVIDHVEQPSEN